VAHPQIFCNQIDQLPNLGLPPSAGIKAITVTAGFETATGNQVPQVRVENNLIAGALGDAAYFANLGAGAAGNALSISRTYAPGSCDPRTPQMPGITCTPLPPVRGR
jgi:hypothetical protein